MKFDLEPGFKLILSDKKDSREPVVPRNEKMITGGAIQRHFLTWQRSVESCPEYPKVKSSIRVTD